jgi:hypothetical protein
MDVRSIGPSEWRIIFLSIVDAAGSGEARASDCPPDYSPDQFSPF